MHTGKQKKCKALLHVFRAPKYAFPISQNDPLDQWTDKTTLATVGEQMGAEQFAYSSTSQLCFPTPVHLGRGRGGVGRKRARGERRVPPPDTPSIKRVWELVIHGVLAMLSSACRQREKCGHPPAHSGA